MGLREVRFKHYLQIKSSNKDLIYGIPKSYDLDKGLISFREVITLTHNSFNISFNERVEKIENVNEVLGFNISGPYAEFLDCYNGMRMNIDSYLDEVKNFKDENSCVDANLISVILKNKNVKSSKLEDTSEWVEIYDGRKINIPDENSYRIKVDEDYCEILLSDGMEDIYPTSDSRIVAIMKERHPELVNAPNDHLIEMYYRDGM